MTAFRLILAILIMLAAAGFALLNWGCLAVNWRSARRGSNKRYSPVPVASLLLAALATAIYPQQPKWWLWLIPLADIGNWSLLMLPFYMLKMNEKRDSASGKGEK